LSSRPSDLPDFVRPPVAEVVLGVQHDPLPLLRTAHLGLLWSLYRQEYPQLEEHPPIETPEEQFEQGVGQLFEVKLMGSPPVPRQWFISADGCRLIQVQQDRFLHNWRRNTPDAEYPRYESLRESFEHRYGEFIRFIEKESLGTANIRQAEVSYINPLAQGNGWDQQGQLERVVRMWTPSYGPGLECPPEDVRFVQRHLISDHQGPYARLYVSIEPVVSGALVLNLTVRGRPRGGTLPAAMDFFDMARERIVRAFAAVTTDEMHRVWGRIQ
jgi:hypothetical protein